MLQESFRKLLDMPLNELEPQPLPPGTYLCIVDGQPYFEKAGEEDEIDCEDDETLYVVFTFRPLRVENDVDQGQLREVLNGEMLSDREITYRMFVDQSNQFKGRINKFLVDDLGIDSTLRLKEALPEAMGKEVYVKLMHQPSKDGRRLLAIVASTAKVL